MNTTDQHKINVHITAPAHPIITKAFEILKNRIERRCSTEIVKVKNDDPQIILSLSGNLPQEAFKIEDDNDTIRIVGGSPNGLLYGIGKFLRTSRYDKTFIPSKWRGTSNPAKPFRGVYLATHFYNYYHIAPLDEIQEYIEDMALWGYNTIGMVLDKHHFNGPEDPAYEEFGIRLRKMFDMGIAVGMKPTIMTICNEGFANTPEHLQGTYPGRSFYGCEVCPSTEEGMKLILENHRNSLERFFTFPSANYALWSYDQGGCACEHCYPWGCNGMYKTAKRVVELVRQYISDVKIIYSTWLFDYRSNTTIEWEGLYRNLAEEPKPWFEYILADSHGEFPKYPLTHPKPKGIEIIGFPEISMWKRLPWGGFGASPQPQRFSGFWAQSCSLLSGGILYSEGIFEDFNKAIWAMFYWNGNNDVDETIKEYANYELGCSDITSFNEVIDILEKNHELLWYAFPEDKLIDDLKWQMKTKPDIYVRKRSSEFQDTLKAYEIIRNLDKKLPSWARKAWRWRLLYIRVFCDYTVDHNNGEPTPEMERYLEELAELYHCNNLSGEQELLYMHKIFPLTDKLLERKRRCKLKKHKADDFN